MPRKKKKNRTRQSSGGHHVTESSNQESEYEDGQVQPAQVSDVRATEATAHLCDERINIGSCEEQLTTNMTTSLNINITSRNTQIGDNNKIVDGASDTLREAEALKTPGARPKIGGVEQINTDQVNVYCLMGNTSENPEHKSSDIKREVEIRKFSDHIGDYKSGYFILIAGQLNRIKNLASLGHISWTAVLDFDTESRFDGLFSYTEATLDNKTSVHINTWQDKFHFTDNNCCWIFTRGSRDRPETLIEKDFKVWRTKTQTCIKNLYQGLENFRTGCLEYTIIVMWPEDEEIRRHLNFTLCKLEGINPHITIVTNGYDTSGLSTDLLENIEVVELNTQDVCNVICKIFSQNKDTISNGYCLPTSDKTDEPDIDKGEAQMLKEELEIIYLYNQTGIEYTLTQLLEEEENFFRGGTLPWSWWYHASEGQADVEREIMSNIMKCIKTDHIDQCKSGRVTLYHFPGSGGTTLAQRVLWNLKKEIPCAQVLHRSDLSLVGLAEKIQLLSDKTRLPILLLMDGEEEQKVEHIQRILTCCIIIFYVKRCLVKPSLKSGEFWLKQFVSKREGQILGMKYINQCSKLNKTETQTTIVRSLIEEIEQGKDHSIFEIGLAVHSYEYRGIYSYVRGFLGLEEKTDKFLLDRHNILIILSLAQYYGQTPVPCQLISGLIETKSNQTFQYQDLPDDIKELIVCDPHERRKNMIRISHYYVAKEILNQVLLWIQNEPEASKTVLSQHITRTAKKALARFVKEFIVNAGNVNKNVASDTILKILIRTIISRDNTSIGENESQATRSKRPKLSPVLEDVSSNYPYKERFDVLTTLAKSFPQEPQFQAHLGRLYTICRPDKEREAENCFQKALEICKTITKHMKPDEIPLNRKFDFVHIYHMYGNMFSTKVSLFTGRNMNDRPRRTTYQEDFESTIHILHKHTLQACGYFVKCRENTPPGCEKSFGFIGEINVRLMFCDFVNRHKCTSAHTNIHEFIENNHTEIGEFVSECFIKLDELFIDCFSSIDPDKMDESVWVCQKWFHFLFKMHPGYVIAHEFDGLDSSRIKIAMLKMKYSNNDLLAILELVNNMDDIKSIVLEYENIFSNLQVDQNNLYISRRNIDIDFKEWLFGIRHSMFPSCYKVEDVLEQVQKWVDITRSPNAKFYLFILKTLLGIGDDESNGDQKCLIESQDLRQDLIKCCRYMTKPKYPREWLGPANSELGIRRVIPGNRFFGQIGSKENHSNLKTTDLNLEIMKGTICPPNDKPAVGYIALDLGPANRIPINVFYVPARCNFRGEMHKGTRVEFVIGFSMFHGYEAFNVNKLARFSCNKCQKVLEYRSCEKIVVCNGCNTTICVDKNGK